MNTNALALVTVLLGLVDQTARIGQLIANARAQNRDVTDEEIAALAAGDDAARQSLVDAIAKAKAEQAAAAA